MLISRRTRNERSQRNKQTINDAPLPCRGQQDTHSLSNPLGQNEEALIQLFFPPSTPTRRKSRGYFSRGKICRAGPYLHGPMFPCQESKLCRCLGRWSSCGACAIPYVQLQPYFGSGGLMNPCSSHSFSTTGRR
jgi:hypothetical protein